MSFRRCRADLVFKPSKNKQITHTSELMWLCMRKQKFTSLGIASLTDSVHVHGPESFLLSLVPPSASAWPFSERCGPLSKVPLCLSFRRPFCIPPLTCHVHTWSLLPTPSQNKKVAAVARSARPFPPFFFLSNLFFPHDLNLFCKWLRRLFEPNVLPWHLCGNSRKMKKGD